MGNFELREGEGVMMFRYGGQIVAAKGYMYAFDVHRNVSPVFSVSDPFPIGHLIGDTDVVMDLRRVHLVTVVDGEPQWDEARSRLPQPRLGDGTSA